MVETSKIFVTYTYQANRPTLKKNFASVKFSDTTGVVDYFKFYNYDSNPTAVSMSAIVDTVTGYFYQIRN